MKKFFLASIVALAMGFAFVSCNQNSGPVDIKTDGTPEEVLTDIVTKAKAKKRQLLNLLTSRNCQKISNQSRNSWMSS